MRSLSRPAARPRKQPSTRPLLTKTIRRPPLDAVDPLSRTRARTRRLAGGAAVVGSGCARLRCRPAGVRPLVRLVGAGRLCGARGVRCRSVGLLVGGLRRWMRPLRPRACPPAATWPSGSPASVRSLVAPPSVPAVCWAGIRSGCRTSVPGIRCPLCAGAAGVRSSWDGHGLCHQHSRGGGLPRCGRRRSRAAIGSARRGGGRWWGAASAAGPGQPTGQAARAAVRGSESSPGE
jgi:hypothetical protein